MKVVYHPRYLEVYAGDPAAKAGRIESILREVSPHYELVAPEPASIEDVKLAHTEWHISEIKGMSHVYEVAILAAGGANKAAELAMSGEPTFGLIRPPGHHASPGSCWGFCFFNNMAISIAKLRKAGKIKQAVILDFDLHYGDGTDNIFGGVAEVVYHHPEDRNNKEFVEGIERFLEKQKADIIAVSAGFDRGVEDWGGLLTTEDYRTIGRLVKEFSERVCQGRRYGVLEGGYNHDVLGKNVKAFLDGIS
jgi:acetoin utilization deacetylase AcuC-like enzyme